MDKFKKASLLERSKMEQVFNKEGIVNYNFTSAESKERHDGTFENKKGTKITFEVKVRNIDVNKYDTTIIEKSKFDYLITQTNPYLFVFYENDVYLSHRLKKNNNYVFSTKMAPRATMGDNTIIKKIMVEIPIIDNEIFKL